MSELAQEESGKAGQQKDESTVETVLSNVAAKKLSKPKAKRSRSPDSETKAGAGSEAVEEQAGDKVEEMKDIDEGKDAEEGKDVEEGEDIVLKPAVCDNDDNLQIKPDTGD